MDYEQLCAGIKYYDENYPHWTKGYRELRRRGGGYWLHLEKLGENQIRPEVIGFLNDWLCRVDYDSAASLKRVLDGLPRLYEAMRDERIEDISFNDLKTINGRHHTNSEVIENIMDRFLSVRPKFGPVAASKLMHMAIPDLFVMWDTGIKSRYGIPAYYAADHARHYVRFLKLMQLQIRHAIDSYARAHDVNSQAAVRQIRMNDSRSTLARAVDKYNFAIRDEKLSICAECYRTWAKPFF